MFYCEEQFEDEYEYGRPFWVNDHQERPLRDESAEAKRLTLAGKTVIMADDGRDHLIEEVCDDYEQARQRVAQIREETAHGLDVGIYQVPPVPQPKPAPSVPDFDDSLPF